MQIEDLKRWHWAILGLIVGLVFSFTWQDHDVVGDKSYEFAEIKQNKFEQYAMSKSRESGQAILQNVRIEPPVHDYQNQLRQIVIGKRLGVDKQSGKERLVAFYYYASVPYTPHIPIPNANLPQNATVADFLAAAHKVNPLLQYRYAWELESNWSIVLWCLGGLVVIGGVWPTILAILLGAGLGRPPKSQAELDSEAYIKRFGKGSNKPKPVMATKGPTDEDMQQLDAMNTALEGQLAAAGILSTDGARQSADDSSVGTTIVPLTAGPAEPAPEHERRTGETEEEFRKRFAAGDFYPVARGVKKE
jgi:hypothetical protein